MLPFLCQKSVAMTHINSLKYILHDSTSLMWIFKAFDLLSVNLVQGVLRLIWSGRLECVFVDPKGAKISKNGNKITC